MEERLVKKAIKGDAKAFQKLLLIHQDQLYRTAVCGRIVVQMIAA
ncbi:hypothetical protein [Enterococcus sp. AZ196]